MGEQHAHGPSEEAPPRILVVDDSATFRRAIGQMLSRAGYYVETASSGEEAFQRAFAERFDAVVSDITMGALSGVQLCRLFRSDPSTKDMPVVLLTAADDPRSRFWGRNAGAAAYVAKERARQELVPEVARVLRQSPMSLLPVHTRAGRRAQPMERLSQVLDELLFRAVVSSEVRRLIHHTSNRVQFGRELVRIAAEVADYSYLVFTLVGTTEATSYTVHARAPWPRKPDAQARDALQLPLSESVELDVVAEEALLVDGPVELDIRDREALRIEAAGETLGNLFAFSAKKRLGAEDRMTLELIAQELGLLAKNVFLLEETRRLANSDALTGMQNRRRATERLEMEVARAKRYGTPLTLALVDIDHFKQVNDRYGHNMGDAVLQSVAHTLQETLRQVDLVGRWGGEEFLILLPETDLESARVVAERLRLGVEAIPPFEDGPEHVHCSIGLASYQGEDNPAVFVDRADQALYQAKEQGRNRVVLAKSA